MPNFFAAAALLILPTRLARMMLPRGSFHLADGVRIGFSWIEVDKLKMEQGSRIGHLNIMRVSRLVLGQRALVGRSNRATGPFGIRLDADAQIGNRNFLIRSPLGVVIGDAELALGRWTKITSDHYLDLTASISLADYCTIAGRGSQIWTHGYVHAEHGLDRYRIDGAVNIEHNVYVGSMSFISMGVNIAAGVIVGGGASVARNLTVPGLYVSAGLRQLPKPADPDSRGDLQPLPTELSCDRVYNKRRNIPET